MYNPVPMIASVKTMITRSSVSQSGIRGIIGPSASLVLCPAFSAGRGRLNVNRFTLGADFSSRLREPGVMLARLWSTLPAATG